MKRFGIFVLSLMGLLTGCLPYAEALTTEQILNASYDSTNKALRLEISSPSAVSSTAYTTETAWAYVAEHQTSGTPANGIGVGYRFYQETSAGNTEYIAGIAAEVTDVTAASEDASLVFYTMTDGAAATQKMALETLAMVVNETSLDYDFRVESNGNEAAIFVDAGNDRVGIFTAAPAVPFEVTGNTLITGTLTTTGAADIPADITLENDEVIDNSVNGTVQVQSETALTNTVSPELSLLHTTSGAPATNIGVGINFVQETSAGNNETGMSLDTIVDDATGATEDFSFSVSLMAGGAAKTEKFAIESTGVVTLVNAATIDNSTNGTVVITEPTIDIVGALKLEQCTIADGDATPDVTGCHWMTTSANTAPTAITDIDLPQVGASYCIVIGNATNPSTIADAGNFALSAAWNPGIDDVLCLYVQADNDYIEISRSDN